MKHGNIVQRETQEVFGLTETECGGCAPPVWAGAPRLEGGEASLALRGARYNKGKPMVGHLIPGFLLEMGAVLTMGAEKYAKDNWKKGMPVREVMDSCLRHIFGGSTARPTTRSRRSTTSRTPR